MNRGEFSELLVIRDTAVSGVFLHKLRLFL
jgi:hypothetical protein